MRRTAYVIGYNNLGAVTALSEAIAKCYENLVILCNDPKFIDRTYKKLYKKYSVVQIDVCSTKQLISFFSEIDFDHKVDSFICMQDKPMFAYLSCLKHLEHTYSFNSNIPLDGIRAARIKPLTRELLSKYGLTPIKWKVCDIEEVESTIEYFKTRNIDKVFIKPVAGMGSELVAPEKTENLKSVLPNIFEELNKTYFDIKEDHFFKINNKSYSIYHSLLIEENLQGAEFTIDGAIQNGNVIAIAQHKESRKISPFSGDGLIISPPSFGESTPAELIPDWPGYEQSAPGSITEADLVKFCTSVLNALNIDNWLFHIELILAKTIENESEISKPTIVEINPRIPGGLLARAFEVRTGINLANAALSLINGDDIQPLYSKYVTGQFPIYWEEGFIESVSEGQFSKNEQKIDTLSMCSRLDVYKKGKENYLAFLMLKGASHEEVRNAAKKIFDDLTPK